MYLTEKSLKIYILTAVKKYTEQQIKIAGQSNIPQEEYLKKSLEWMAMETEAINFIERQNGN